MNRLSKVIIIYYYSLAEGAWRGGEGEGGRRGLRPSFFYAHYWVWYIEKWLIGHISLEVYC